MSSLSRPIMEMTIPSVLDPTLAPPGHHVASFFIQYAPYTPKDGPWTEEKKDAFVKKGNNLTHSLSISQSHSLIFLSSTKLAV